MEENKEIDKGVSRESSDVSGELASGEIISPKEIPVTAAEEPKTENNKPKTEQTDQMEVHKHPHHVAHKKKWGGIPA